MSDFETRTIPATVHGRYLVRDGPPERLLVGFHGYGETAEAHMAELRQIPGVDRWTIVAVQALHPFYTNRTGTIVASWMTSLDRVHAIEDNRVYVHSVVTQFPARQQVVFLGFSQGAAMAYRAAIQTEARAVIALGGDVPPEVEEFGISVPVLIGRGSRDDFYTDEKFQKDLRFLRQDLPVSTCVYDGAHEWTAEFREAAGKFLARL
ncbi:MAG TPA: dienelactone hydrolase family protein [Thermoanaerobaculia bacterium]|jgi:predicted esterase|nr:dienelactone hydrolase family protein [Thermoanaerobaculia bacterium]